MKTQQFPSFRGKIVLFYRRSFDRSSLLKNINFQTHAGRLFVCGAVAPEGSAYNWARGLSIAVAWEEVAEYIVFNSAADYKRRAGSNRGWNPQGNRYGQSELDSGDSHRRMQHQPPRRTQ